MLMSTTRCLNMMKAWVVDTGLIPNDEEMREGLKTDMWGILTPNRNNLVKEDIKVQDDKENKSDEELNVEFEFKENAVISSSCLNLTPHKILSDELTR